MSCQSAWKGVGAVTEGLQSLLLLAIRLIFGYQFFTSGFGKFGNIASVISYFGELGIPFPEWNACFVASAECIGGILLVIGLCTRPTALLLMLIMFVAYITAHSEAIKHLFINPMGFVKESPFNFLLATLFLFAFGPGKISLDHFIGQRFCK